MFTAFAVSMQAHLLNVFGGTDRQMGTVGLLINKSSMFPVRVLNASFWEAVQHP